MTQKSIKNFAILNGDNISIYSRFDFIDGVEERKQTAYIYVMDCTMEYLKDKSIPILESVSLTERKK